MRAAGRNPFLRAAPSAETPWRTAPDWPGFPARVAGCLTRREALALLDWHGAAGPRALQEEYVEWRVVRDGEAIRRVELTTELGDYWRVLAAFAPERTLALVAGFAGRERVAPRHVYGRECDPFARGVTPAERERAFAATMLDPEGMSPYNDGTAAICCMVQPTNTLEALLAMACAATTPRIVLDVVSGRRRCLTCDEAIPLLGGTAMGGRGSDPVLVERLGRLAFEGRLVAFDDPLGVYIAGVEHGRLRAPDGAAVPREWFRLGRGSDGRRQRLVLEPPRESGLAVSDLVDAATEQPIRHGGQIADLVQVVVPLRVSDGGVVDEPLPDPAEVAEAEDDARDCAAVRKQHEAFAARA
jgi:hypothetical protein